MLYSPKALSTDETHTESAAVRIASIINSLKMMVTSVESGNKTLWKIKYSSVHTSFSSFSDTVLF